MRSFSSLLLSDELRDSFIRNDNKNGGECMHMYFELCAKCGLHKEFRPDDYGWLWIYVGDSEYIQQAPERKFIRGKKELTREHLENLKTITEGFMGKKPELIQAEY